MVVGEVEEECLVLFLICDVLKHFPESNTALEVNYTPISFFFFFKACFHITGKKKMFEKKNQSGWVKTASGRERRAKLPLLPEECRYTWV